MKKTNYLISGLIFVGLLSLPVAVKASVMNMQTKTVQNNQRTDENKEVVKFLMVWDNEGSFVSFPLQERPRIVTDVRNNEIVCITSKQEVSFSLDEVHKYTLETDSESASVENITSDNSSFSKEANSLGFENFKPGSHVYVYTLDGMVVGSYNINEEGSLTISMEGWNTGVYIIKTDSVTYKVVKK